MIRVKVNNTVYSFEGHADFVDSQLGYTFHFPFSLQSGSAATGFAPREMTLLVPLNVSFNPFEITEISFDEGNTWYKVLLVTEMNSATQPTGWYDFAALKLYVLPYRTGVSHTSSEVWGRASVNITTNGNYPAPVKLVYKGADFYFPLDTDLKANTGSALSYTRDGSVSHNGVSYDANNPVFDEGLYFNGNDNVTLPLAKTMTDYTIFLILRWKGDADYNGIILDLGSTGAQLYWDDSTVLMLSSIGDYSVTFPQTDYEAGKPVAVILTHKSDGSGELMCGIYDEDTGQLSNVQKTSYTDTDMNNMSGSINIGIGMKQNSISDLTVYSYAVNGADTKEWHMTTEPLRFNDFYISNITGGMITYENGKLTDESGNDITGLVSGIPLTEGDIEMTAGLSGFWSVEASDTYLP